LLSLIVERVHLHLERLDLIGPRLPEGQSGKHERCEGDQEQETDDKD
jgi:hypothetical protein